jgi:1,4-alpha-glucan branching enzyme
MVSRTDAGWRFRLVRPEAHRAYLVGDFNGWSTTTVQMTRTEPGVFVATLELEPGTYRFRYFVDGMWLVDYAAFGLERNALGQWDSVIYVPAPPPRPAAARRRIGDHHPSPEPATG